MKLNMFDKCIKYLYRDLYRDYACKSTRFSMKRDYYFFRNELGENFMAT